MNGERSPSCERCIWFTEAVYPREYVMCAHPVHRGLITDLDELRCAGAGFKPCEPNGESST